MRLFLLSYHALNLTLASRNQHAWCVTWHFTKDSSLQMFQRDMQTCFCSEYMERVVRVCITEWKYWIFFANLWLINASKISLFKTPRDWGWYCTQSLPSLCHAVADDPHNRPTWLFCVFGSSRRLLCSEKKLVSFLESSSTPWGKRVIISLLLEYRFLKDCMWSTVSNPHIHIRFSVSLSRY